MNKVEKIKAEIERLKQQFMSQADNFHSLGMEEKEKHYIALASNMAALIRYIDSLSDTEKDFGIKEFIIPFGASDSELMEATYFIPQGHHAVIDGNKVIIKKGEEPVSNDLEKAAVEAFKNIVDSDKNSFYEIFKAGAQWKEQRLMENTVEAVIHPYDGEIYVNKDLLSTYDDCQRVKLIIIEEE